MRAKLAMIKCLESETNGLSGMKVGLKTYILFSKFYFIFGMQSYLQWKKNMLTLWRNRIWWFSLGSADENADVIKPLLFPAFITL